MFLTPDEIAQLTGRKRKDSQRMALTFMGIAYRVRLDGSLAVLKSHIEKEFDGQATDDTVKHIEPNWAAI